jgi:hypothetical protein
MHAAGRIGIVATEFARRAGPFVTRTGADDALSKLVRALKAPKREGEMLRYLAGHADTDPGLVAYVRQDATVTFDEFASAAGMVFRGAARPDYSTRIRRVRQILSDEDDHG